MPPMPRSSPFWYRRYYHSITSLFAESFRHTDDRIYVLPTYAKPDYEVDGIHLTEESGPRFVNKLPICKYSSIFPLALPLLCVFHCIVFVTVTSVTWSNRRTNSLSRRWTPRLKPISTFRRVRTRASPPNLARLRQIK
jgi:hypothetical protein